MLRHWRLIHHCNRSKVDEDEEREKNDGLLHCLIKGSKMKYKGQNSITRHLSTIDQTESSTQVVQIESTEGSHAKKPSQKDLKLPFSSF